MTMIKMKPGIRYVVTKSSTDKTFFAGDHVRLGTGGSIDLCGRDAGWINADQVPLATKGWQIEPDRKWIAERIDKIETELAVLKGVDDE